MSDIPQCIGQSPRSRELSHFPTTFRCPVDDSVVIISEPELNSSGHINTQYFWFGFSSLNF